MSLLKQLTPERLSAGVTNPNIEFTQSAGHGQPAVHWLQQIEQLSTEQFRAVRSSLFTPSHLLHYTCLP